MALTAGQVIFYYKKSKPFAMKQMHAMLMQGDGHGARARLGQLVRQEPERAAQAAEIAANLLWTAYEFLHLQPVHDFCQDLALDLPPAVAEQLRQSLEPKIQRTREWTGRLREVTRERLVREARAMIVRGDLRQAAARCAVFLQRITDESQIDEECQTLARGLAELERDHERILAVIGALMKAGGETATMAAFLADHYNRLHREQRSTSFQSNDLAWSRVQTETVLSLREFLPGPMEIGEPDDAQLERFYGELHAVVRAGVAGRNREDFIDALTILMDYCPADPAAIQNVAGVEDRMFTRLGPRAKLTCVRALGKLGQLEPVRKFVLGLAQSADKEDRVRLLTAAMGGLRHADFFPYLKEQLKRAENARDEEALIEALGRIGNPEAVELLLERFGVAVKKMARDPAQERRAHLLLTAFGRIGRAKGVTPEQRNALVGKLTALADASDNRKLAFAVVREMFANRPEEFSAELRDWAARKSVEAMWIQQPEKNEAVASVNGWRQPMVTALLRLGRSAQGPVIQAAAKYASQYSGAMGALANVLAEIGDQRATALLETMIRVAFFHQDGAKQSKLLEEKIIDPATGQARPLDRDDLVHTLLYTLDKIGGDSGVKIVLDYADQVQAGRLTAPGTQTINFLVDLKLKHGRLAGPAAAPEPPAPAVDEKELKKALAEARGGLLTKKATRIAALATLGQMRQPESTGVLLEALGDKDVMISSAAHTALAQFLQPLPGETGYAAFLDALLEHPERLKDRVLDRFLEFVARELPKNPPYDKLLERHLEVAVEDGALAHRIRCAAAKPKEAKGAGPSAGGADAGEEGGLDAGVSVGRSGAETELDKRMAYMQARRAWLAGGKKGEPPKPPS